jgi:hypothetical protein
MANAVLPMAVGPAITIRVLGLLMGGKGKGIFVSGFKF